MEEKEVKNYLKTTNKTVKKALNEKEWKKIGHQAMSLQGSRYI